MLITVPFMATFAYCVSSTQEKVVTRTDVFRKILKNTCDYASSKYELQCSGVSESVDKEKRYIELGLNFHIKGPIPKDEGRALILDMLDKFLEEINTTQDFKQYMTKYPFDPKNVCLSVYVKDASGRSIYYPEILLYSVWYGTLGFKTSIPEDDYGFYSRESESIEEARDKVNKNLKD